jgi:DNA polymerase III sliding clamp (beta) subunit (PCNA family)
MRPTSLNSKFKNQNAKLVRRLSNRKQRIGDRGEDDGEENQIAFNSRYLVDFLNSTDASVLEMTTPLAPGVRPVGMKTIFT